MCRAGRAPRRARRAALPENPGALAALLRKRMSFCGRPMRPATRILCSRIVIFPTGDRENAPHATLEDTRRMATL